MKTIYLGLGANVGNAEAQLAKAVYLLGERAWVVSQSALYVTRPFGYEDQPNFLNAVVKLETELSVEELHAWTKDIENRLGRTRTIRNGPREIDIDILLYGDEIVKTEKITVPHRDLSRRDFVLRPLLDLDQELKDPCTGESLSDLLQSMATEERYVLGVYSRKEEWSCTSISTQRAEMK